MSDILEDTKFMIMVMIFGAIVCVIGYAFLNGWIVGFGIASVLSVPVGRVILAIL